MLDTEGRWTVLVATVLLIHTIPHAHAAPAACRLTHADIDGDGAKEVVLENGFLRATLEPSSGGRAARVEYKPGGVDLTCFGPYRGTRPGGLFGDRITTQSFPGDYLEATAAVAVVKNTPDEVRVRLTSRGQGGQAANLIIEKEWALARSRSSLEVAATMAYRTGMTDPKDRIRTGLWWQHILRVGKTGSQQGFRNTYSLPLTNGILQVPFVPQARNHFEQDDSYVRNPARGWIGTVAQPGDGAAPVGAVFSLDYSQLLHYYICMVPGMLEFPTVEWYYQKVNLRDGETCRTKVSLMPFRGLDEVTGAHGGIVGRLRFDETACQVGRTVPVRISLVSDRARQATVEVADRLLTWHTGKHTTTVVGAKPVSLGMDQAAALEMPVSFKTPGTHVICIRVRGADGEEVVTFEKPVVVGERSGNYALEPTQARVVVDPTVKRRPNLSGPATPHVPWAKPLRGGPIRVLLVSDICTARQVVELGQRLDMRCDDVLCLGPGLVEKDTPMLWGHRSAPTRHHYQIEEHESEAERLRRLLRENRYDVMVVCPDGMRLTNVPKDVSELAQQRVREGMGLVCLNPKPHKLGTGWLDSVSSLVVGPGSGIPHHIHLRDDDVYYRKGIVRTAQRGQLHADGLAALVPMRILPPTAMYTRERLAKAEGDAVVEYRSAPMLVLGKAGEGRVATLNADVHNLELNAYFEDQLPAMRGERYQEYPYREYSYLLLSKMIRWAAKREADLRLARIGVTEALRISVCVENTTNVDQEVAVEITLRDPFFRPVNWSEGRAVRSITARGQSDISFQARGPFAAGRYTADVALRDRAGQVADSGSAAIHVPGSTIIAGVKPRRPLQRLGEPAEIDVTIEGSPSGKMHMDWRLVDTYRRTVQTGTTPLGREAVTFSTRPIQTTSAVLDLDVTLWDGSRPLHRHVSYLFVRRSPRIEDVLFEVYILAGGAKATRSFAFMRELGVDAGGVSYSGCPWNKAFLALKHNLVPLFGSQFISDFGYYGVPRTVREGPPRSWPDVKPDDPPNVRVWPGITRPGGGGYAMCPHHPTGVNGRMDRVRKRGSLSMLYSPLDYFISDESCFQRDVYARKQKSTDDLCFCRYCLAAFREYLKREYGSLDALNAGWDTAYRSWDEATPLPGRQARLLENWSRWIDFRIFTAKSFCGSVVQVQDRLRETDPRARTSANIHWESPWTAFMAYYLHGPNANRTTEIYPRTFEQGRSYSPEPAYRRIHLGYATYPGHPRTITDHYAWRNLGYGGGRTDFYNGIEGLVGGVLMPTFKEAPMAEWLKALDAAMRKTGIGKAILTSTPDPTVVGVVESYPSQFTYYLEPQHFDKGGYYRRGDYTMWHDVKRVWGSYGRLAEDLGLPWRLVNEEELTASVPAGMRVVILPRATCLASRTAHVLDRFVSDGGIAIADVRLAERDRHGRPASAGAPEWLERLFGVQRDRVGHQDEQLTCSVAASELIASRSTIATTCHELHVQPAGAVTHGTFADGAAHTLIRRHGKGYFVYLNYELWGYSSSRAPAVREVIGGIFARAGVKARSGLFGTDGKPVVNALCLRRTRGAISYYFVLRNLHGPSVGEAELVLPARAHLYDVGSHRYLGHATRLPIVPKTTRGQLIATLPYRVEGIAVVATKQVAQGQKATVSVSVRTSSDQPGGHVIRLEVTHPDGTPCPYWSRNVLSPGARWSDEWTTALDEQQGEWRIRALDVLSGKTAEATFQIVAGPG